MATYAIAFSLYFTVKMDSSCNTETGSLDLPKTTHCCKVCSNYQYSYYEYYEYYDNYGDKTENETCLTHCTNTGDAGPIYVKTQGTYDECCIELSCRIKD